MINEINLFELIILNVSNEIQPLIIIYSGQKKKRKYLTEKVSSTENIAYMATRN